MALSKAQTPQLYTASAATTVAGTLPTQPTAGNLLVAVLTINNSGGTGAVNPTITDNASNSWTRIQQTFDGTPTTDTSIHYATNIATIASFTVTGHSGSSTNCALTVTVYEIAGADPTTPWISGQAVGNTGTGTAPPTGSLTNSNANAIFIAAVNNDDSGNPGTLTGPSGFTLDTSELNGATYGVCGCASLIVTTTGTQNLTWTTANVVYTTEFAWFQAVVPTPVVIAPNNANLFWSRNNWYVNGASYASSNNPGAKFAMAWSIPSGGAGQFTLTVDTTPEGGASLAAGSYPSLEYSVDGGALTSVQLAGNSATTTPINLTGLAASATHTILCYFKDTDGTTGDRWTTPVQVVKVISATIDNGAATVALSGTNLATQSGECLVFGDSITEGDFATGSAVTNGDGMTVFGHEIARALGCEASIVGFGGQGYTKTGNSGTNVPTFHTAGTPASQTWRWFWNGQSRLTGTTFTAMPTHIVIFHGFNDNASTDAAVEASVQDCLLQMRLACGASKTHIHVMLPVAPKKHTAITTGFNNYQAATPDPLTHLYDLTTLYSIPLLSAELNGVGAATIYSYDGTHPNATTHGLIGALMADAIRHRLDGPKRVGMAGGF